MISSHSAAIRIGVVLPSVNTVVEPWFNRVVPAGVTVHASRMQLANELTAEALRRMDQEDGARAICQLAGCRPTVVAYCCTASTFIGESDHDERVIAVIRSICGVEGTTATAAVLEALRVSSATRVAVLSPYTDLIAAAERRYLEVHGISIVSERHLGITDGFLLAAPDPSDLYERIRTMSAQSADAVLVTCLNLRAHPIIEALEAELGIPIITSTQALLWKCLRLAGISAPLVGYGRLFREH